MKTKSKICLLLAPVPFVFLLGVFAQSGPAASASAEPESAITPSAAPAMPSEPLPAMNPAPAAESAAMEPESAMPAPAAPEASAPVAQSEPATEAKAAEPAPAVKLPPVTVAAKTPEQAYLDAVVPDPTLPYPLEVHFPAFRDTDYGYNYGRELEMEFVVGADGVPRSFRVKTATLEPRLTNQIITAMKSWRFSPAHQGDVAVDRRASIKARISHGPEAVTAVAMK